MVNITVPLKIPKCTTLTSDISACNIICLSMVSEPNQASSAQPHIQHFCIYYDTLHCLFSLSFFVPTVAYMMGSSGIISLCSFFYACLRACWLLLACHRILWFSCCLSLLRVLLCCVYFSEVTYSCRNNSH